MTHTSTEQPEINELCQWFNEGDGFKQGTAAPHKWVLQANSEISHQHARIAELEAQLSAIGAGGVEPLRKQAAAQGMDANNSIGTLWVEENGANDLELCPCAAPKLAPGEYAIFAQAKQGGA